MFRPLRIVRQHMPGRFGPAGQSEDGSLIGRFELSNLQYESHRRRQRRLLLLRSLPLVILVLAIALWCLLPELLTRQAIKNYDHKSYHVARRWLTPLTWTSPQPFVIAFNSGTVDTQIGNYNIAQTELNKALKLAPPDKRCMVLQNLVYSLDAHAANLQHNSSSHAATPYSNQAASLTKSNPKCFQIAALTNHSKLQKKQSGGGGGSQSQQGLTSVQQQQLTQKNQLGQALSQQSLSQDSINPNSPAIKPW